MGIRDNDREHVRPERQSWCRTATPGETAARIQRALITLDDEGLKNIGPLPEGIYTFGTPVDHSHLGAFAIPLIPDPANNMLGRGGFYLHGDTVQYQAASEGCIIQPLPTRDACWASPDHQLQVVRVFSKVNTAA